MANKMNIGYGKQLNISIAMRLYCNQHSLPGDSKVTMEPPEGMNEKPILVIALRELRNYSCRSTPRKSTYIAELAELDLAFIPPARE